MIALALLSTQVESAPVARPILFAKPRLAAYGFAEAPRIPLVADVDGDRFADLVAVYPPNPGIVDVALNTRTGKFAAPEAVARDLGAELVAAWTRPGREGRAEVVVLRPDGNRRVVALTPEGASSVREETGAEGRPSSPPAEAASSGAAPRIVVGDFDGDGRQDEVAGETLRLAAQPERRADLTFLRQLPPGAIVVAGDVSGDGRDDLVVFRRDEEWRRRGDVTAYVAYREGDPDADGDGLDGAAESRSKTDPLDADTDHDGLPDG